MDYNEKDAKLLRHELSVKKRRKRLLLLGICAIAILLLWKRLSSKTAEKTTTIRSQQRPYDVDNIVPDSPSSLPEDSIYRLSVVDQFGSQYSLSRFVGKVTLIVNTVCKSEMTQVNFKQLAKLHEELAPYGFSVIAFPTSDFHQELLDNESIFAFLQNKFPEITFPIMGLSVLKQNPVYRQLQKQLPDVIVDDVFYKILVDRHGRAIKAYKRDQIPMASISDIRSFVVNHPRI
jgi:glutathione peroxidase-family protein